MTYQAWTAKAVELRVVEAAETLMLTPNTYGSSSAWPQIVRSPDESYGYGSSWYKKRPSAGALDRMLVTWSWINALPSREDRQLLYAWAWTKVKRGRFLSDFAAREGAKSKTIRRAITASVNGLRTISTRNMLRGRTIALTRCPKFSHTSRQIACQKSSRNDPPPI